MKSIIIKEKYEEVKEKKDCQTCKEWKNGKTMIDCWAKHYYSKENGCAMWQDANKINYSRDDI